MERIKSSFIPLLFVGLFLLIMKDYAHNLVWAGILAIAFWPSYLKYSEYLSPRFEFLSPWTLACVCVALSLMPLFVLISEASSASIQMEYLYRRLACTSEMKSCVNGLNLSSINVPFIANWLENPPAWFLELNTSQFLRGDFFLEKLPMWAGALALTIKDAVMSFLLLTFIFSLKPVIQDIQHTLSWHKHVKYVSLFLTLVRLSFTGVLFLGVFEGLIMTVLFTWDKIPSPLFFGLVVGLATCVPLISPLIILALSFLVWIDSGVFPYLAVVGGLSVVLILDSVVRPVLLGKSARVPFVPMLLAVFGSLAVLGIVGLFLGPAIMGVSLTIFRDWKELYVVRK